MEELSFEEFLMLWYRHQQLRMPALHRHMAHWLEAGWRDRKPALLLMAFRSAGKSTVVGLYCAWLLFVDPNLRILVLAADQTLATKMVRNVKHILERHPFTGHIKPERAEEWAAGRFTINRARELRDPSMLAAGVTSNITGARADVVICDDVEVPNTCDTADKRGELRGRLAEIEFVLSPGGLQLYVGTPHTYYSIYAETPRREAGETRPFLEGFERLILPIEGEDGAPAWPERFPAEKIERLRERAGPMRFASQMLLRPVSPQSARLAPERLKPYAADLRYAEGNGEAWLTLDGCHLVSASCWWDPAYGAPGRGDASVVACIFTDDGGRYYLHRLAYLEHDPALTGQVDEATQQCRQVAAFARACYLPSVTLETNGVGRFLPNLLRRELAEMEVPTAVVEASSHVPKARRIVEAFDALLAAGGLWAHESVFATPFVREMREWRPGAPGQRDDGLDAVSGCLLAEPVRLPRRPFAGRRLWSGTPAFTAPAGFDV
jgi:hypothetical protein